MSCCGNFHQTLFAFLSCCHAQGNARWRTTLVTGRGCVPRSGLVVSAPCPDMTPGALAQPVVGGVPGDERVDVARLSIVLCLAMRGYSPPARCFAIPPKPSDLAVSREAPARCAPPLAVWRRRTARPAPAWGEMRDEKVAVAARASLLRIAPRRCPDRSSLQCRSVCLDPVPVMPACR